MPPVKVAVLGGSGLATPALVEAIVEHPGRRTPIELVLAGRDKEKLELVTGIARLLAGGDPLLSISCTTDTEQALGGADFVLNQVRVGGLEARAFDESFPQKLGIPGEETVGPGGFANASRTIPVVLEYARLIERVAPGALLLTFANPSSLVQYAVTRETQVRTIGLCDGPVTLAERIARAVGAPAAELDLDYIGQHHFGWATGVRWKGRDAMAEALDRAELAAPDVEPAILRAIGAIPGTYFNYLFHPDHMLARQAGKRTRAEELIELQDAMLADYRASLASGRKPASLERRRAGWYRAIIAPILMALVERETRKLVLNIINGTAIPWLPAEAVVEVPCLVEAGAIHPLATGPAPSDVRAMLIRNCTYEMLAVEAIVARDRAKALRALMLNPMVGSYSQAAAVLELSWPE
jgi:6-phospho-beta-glucosidase